MNDFGAKVRQATKEVAAKSVVSQSKKKPNPAKYGYKKDGTPRKSPARQGRWKKGEPANPETVWKPGQSGNPGGRPSMKPITDALRTHGNAPYSGKEARYRGFTNAQVLAIKQYDDAIESGNTRAAIEIMDRVEGKTVQVQQHQGPSGGAINFTNLSLEDNEKRIAELEALARGEDIDESSPL